MLKLLTAPGCDDHRHLILRLFNHKVRLVQNYSNFRKFGTEPDKPSEVTAKLISIFTVKEVESMMKHLISLLQPVVGIADYAKCQRATCVLFHALWDMFLYLPLEVIALIGTTLNRSAMHLDKVLKEPLTLVALNNQLKSVEDHLGPTLPAFQDVKAKFQDMMLQTVTKLEMLAQARGGPPNWNWRTCTLKIMMQELDGNWLKGTAHNIWADIITATQKHRKDQEPPPPQEDAKNASNSSKSDPVRPSAVGPLGDPKEAAKNDSGAFSALYQSIASSSSAGHDAVGGSNSWDSLFSQQTKGQKLKSNLEQLWSSGPSIWSEEHKKTVGSALKRYKESGGDLNQYDDETLNVFIVDAIRRDIAHWPKEKIRILERVVKGGADLSIQTVAELNKVLLDKLTARRQREQLLPRHQQIFDYNLSRGRVDNQRRFYVRDEDADFRMKINQICHPDQGADRRRVDRALQANCKQMRQIIADEQPMSSALSLGQVAAS